MVKIAVTGPISSGKSTVCELFKQHSATVINADEIVHKLLQSDKKLQKKINLLLNTSLTFNDASYRKKIANLVFNDQNLLHEYEKLVHPLVFKAIDEAYKGNKSELFVCEVPLLLETGMESFFDKVIYVYADPLLCQQRFSHKPGHNLQEWEKRMKQFISPEKAKEHASFVITNNSSYEELKNQVNYFINSLQIN